MRSLSPTVPTRSLRCSITTEENMTRAKFNLAFRANSEKSLRAKLKRLPAPRFLIILPRQLGDVILGLPLIKNIHASYPSAQIAWVAHPMAREVLANQPGLSQIYFLPKKKQMPHRRGWSFVSGTVRQWLNELKFFMAVRKFKADAVIDSMNNPRTALIAGLSGAPDRVTFKTRFIRNIFFNHLVDRQQISSGYLGRTRLQLLDPLGAAPVANAPSSSYTPRIYTGEQERNTIDHILRQGLPPDWESKGFVALCPPHRRAVRQWGATGFLSVAKHVTLVRRQAVVWLWGPGEYEQVFPLHKELVRTLITSNCDERLSYCVPLLGVAETAELCRRSVCWVGNSSGLSHVAVAAGCRTIEIHGPTTSKPWTHPDRTRHRSVSRESGCLACEQNTCKMKRRECLDDLEPHRVIAELENLLAPCSPGDERAESPPASSP